MYFSFENQGTHSYLVYTVAEDDEIDSLSLGMLTNNKIQGLAHTVFTQMDATKYIKYDVSAKISVKQFFTGQVNKKRLIGVFRGIVDAMLSAEDYMINVNSIILDLEYIFADVSTCETVLVCLPIVSDDLRSRDLGAFFKNIMFSTQFDQSENCDYVARIINYLNSSPVFSLTDFKKLLDTIGETTTPGQMKQPVAQKPQIPQTQPPIQQLPRQETVKQPVPQKVPAQQPIQQKPIAQPPVNQPKVQAPPAQQHPARQKAPEKKITMMDLLMHYSRENAELYKQQKAAKKFVQGQPKAAPAQQQKKQPTQPGFAIPGQAAPVNPGFAVPGRQTAPAPAPAAAKTEQPKRVPQGGAAGKCRQCGAEMKPGQAFCSRCGARNSAAAGSPQPVQPPIAQQPVQQPMGPVNFGETTVLGGGGVGETTVLGSSAAPVKNDPHLVRTKNNEKIPLNKPVFRIGKERSYVDYFVADNTAVSRSHANIINHNGEFFVVDTNSTNHTYVNGGMIQSNTEVKLSHGTKLRLANEEFEFRLY